MERKVATDYIGKYYEYINTTVGYNWFNSLNVQEKRLTISEIGKYRKSREKRVQLVLLFWMKKREYDVWEFLDGKEEQRPMF